jgi:hypothetical protein
MKPIIAFLFLLPAAALPQAASPQFLTPPAKGVRAPLESLDRKGFLTESNIQRILVLPCPEWQLQLSGIRPYPPGSLSQSNVQPMAVAYGATAWQLSGIGPGPFIDRFKKAFQSSAPMVPPSSALEALVNPLPSLPATSSPRHISWSNIYFLTRGGDFLTFGVVDEGYIFYTRETVGLLPKQAEPDGPANRSQPIRSETNRTSSAAGSGR